MLSVCLVVKPEIIIFDFSLQELISSPLGIKNSQSDSQSESSQGNNQEESGQSSSHTTGYPHSCM